LKCLSDTQAQREREISLGCLFYKKILDIIEYYANLDNFYISDIKVAAHKPRSCGRLGKPE